MAVNLDVEQLRTAISTTAILDAYGMRSTLRNGWHRLKQCPRCGEVSSREAIAVEDRTGRWLHHGHERAADGACSGDVYDFIAACEGVDVRTHFVQVKQRAAAIAGVSGETVDTARAEQLRRRREAEDLAEQARREAAALDAAEAWPHLHRRHATGELYLASRGLDAHELVRAEAVRFSCAGDPCVAIRNRVGAITSVATRFVEPGDRPKVMVRKGTGTAGTMIDTVADITSDRATVIVEGVADAFTARLAWPTAVVLGANGAGNIAKIVTVAVKRLRLSRSQLVFVPHHDSAGINAVAAAVRIAHAGGLSLRSDIRVIDLPEPDLNAAYAKGWRP